MVLRRIDARDGSSLEIKVIFNIGRLWSIKIVEDKLVVLSHEKLLGRIDIKTILKLAKYGLSFVEEAHF